ncbi:uncharacterized protein LOC117129308 [Brassica rapa]|uniref:uncharacterized protein LOC117129308 n=1 Tax=Brassica campestris TaxID=3711 RepID=UPI00142E5858|nr:uncharacterized protein LOC117129308 [Brassica rapa]
MGGRCSKSLKGYVPPQLYSIDGISVVSSAIGEPLHTEKSRLDPYHFGDTKVKIEIQLESEPPRLVEVRDDQGNAVRIQVEYPSLPPRCLNCGKFGHLLNRCLKPLVKRNKPFVQTSLQQDKMVSTSTKISLETGASEQEEEGEIKVDHEVPEEKRANKKKSKRKGRSRSRVPSSSLVVNSTTLEDQPLLVIPEGSGVVERIEKVEKSEIRDVAVDENQEEVKEHSRVVSVLSDGKGVNQDVLLEEEENEPKTPSGDDREEDERLWFKHPKAVRKAIRQELWHSTIKKQPPKSAFSFRNWGSASMKTHNL